MSLHRAHEKLAESGACTVQRCPECGTVHVHFGHASVRLKPVEFLTVCQTLFMAMRRLTPPLDSRKIRSN